MEQSKCQFRLSIILVFMLCSQYSLSQVKPDLLRTLPEQIGVDGKTIYDDLKIDNLITSSGSILYKYDENCRLKEFCTSVSGGTFCKEVIYEDDNIIRIGSGSSAIEYEYDEKGRLVYEEGISFKYERRYDSLDREIFCSERQWFSGGGGTGGSRNIKQYSYDSLGRVSVYIEDQGNFDNTGGTHSERKRLDYIYKGDVIILSIEDKVELGEQGGYFNFDTTHTVVDYYYENALLMKTIENQEIRSRNEFFNPDTVRTTYKYKLNEFKYEDSILIEELISDSIGPIELFEYTISDTLEEYIMYEYIDSIWVENSKGVEKFENGLLVEETLFYYYNFEFNEGSRETFKYDSSGRRIERVYYRNSELSQLEKHSYDVLGNILEYDNISFRDGFEDYRSLTLYVYDSHGQIVKMSLLKYRKGDLTDMTITEYTYDENGVLLNSINGTLNKNYKYSNCGTTHILDHEELSKLTVYPNPTFSDLNVDLIDEDQVDYFVIYDITGKEYFKKSVSSKSEIINTQEFLERGTYILSAIRNGERIYNKFFVKI